MGRRLEVGAGAVFAAFRHERLAGTGSAQHHGPTRRVQGQCLTNELCAVLIVCEICLVLARY
jgi:hypothetical protein